MLSRTALKLPKSNAAAFARNFSSSTLRREYHHPYGPYNNLPFAVHNRKRVPFAALFWGYFALGMGIPGFITWFYLKKSGNL
ncbi:hypothetical protein DASB73_022160 [Starmerella bacillaris]|uniref:Cytochrome c oxidase subunit 8, mitochondrial n=1 Tax=Starmerella bacillaris TaxID=1247836 RepID=A0AAV5RIH1_STABA|nr:hypothetical protein DASB73_022160 [Starmerella bacillaris]